MSPVAIAFLLVSGLALLTVPRRWASVPLLVACCYITVAQSVELGPIRLPIFRLVLALGFLRLLVRGERLAGPFGKADRLMLVLAIWSMFASLFHEFGPGTGPEYTSGVMFNICGTYFLVRIFCREASDVTHLITVVALMLVPVAIEMTMEKLTGRNLFSLLGGVPEYVVTRQGELRAQGPFMHPILAGTVGATCIPLMCAIWRDHRSMAMVGLGACVAMVIACASSGPQMSAIFAAGAVFAWRWRHLTRAWRWGALFAYLALEVIMERPAYFIISRFDLTGGSTGWHRAFLIHQSFSFLHEWWLFGTDYTHHWMPHSIVIQERHADITNYYIAFGVLAGLPAVALVVMLLVRAFRAVGESIRALGNSPQEQFLIWCLGAGMFAHAATSISVAYFDQSVIFFWLNLAIIISIHSYITGRPEAAGDFEPVLDPIPDEPIRGQPEPAPSWI